LPSDPAAYTWDEDARQFRDRWNRLVSRTKVRESLDQYLDKLQVEMHGYTEDMGNGSLSIGRWQEKMEGAIKRGHTAAVAIAKGGWKQATAADWGKAGPEIRFQYARLNRFAKQLEGGLEVHGGTIARAGMYALAPTKTYESILRQGDIGAGFDLERRITHSAETCPECIEYAGRGWRPAGELPDIGVGSSCLSRCRCTFERKRTKPKPPRIPEPEPLPEPPKTKRPRTVKPPEVKEVPKPRPLDPIAEAREVQRAANLEAAKSLKNPVYDDLLKRYPDLIPPGPIQERIEKYTVGDAKLRAVLEVSAKHDLKHTELGIERTKHGLIQADLMKQQSDLSAPYVGTNRPIPPKVAEKVYSLQNKIDAEDRLRREFQAKQESVSVERTDEIRGILNVEQGVNFQSVNVQAGERSLSGPLSPLTLRTRSFADKAERWLGSTVAKGDRGILTVGIGEGPNYRAHYNEDRDRIQVAENQDVSGIIHEYGHAMDRKIMTGGEPLLARSREFLEHRVGDEQPIDMYKEFGIGRPGEMGRADRFDEVFDIDDAYYVGRVYDSGATEITSMGLQQLYRDPAHFARNDPEYFKFILGIMDGSLR
jgi:hypothetical protein